MPNNIAHFAITATDLPRAMRFYERVFGWRFEPWGPPGFYLICTGTESEPGIQGALQGTGDYASPPGRGGVEITVAVDDVEAAAKRVAEAGGTVDLAPATIPTVGTLIKFTDTEGNCLCAMQYDPAYLSLTYPQRRGPVPVRA